VPLSNEQRREAVGLLAELLVDAARRSAGVVSGGGFPGAFDGVSGGVASLPDNGAKRCRAA
jgi:hypothetical protein